LRHLARREHSRAELERKLRPYALAEAEATGAEAAGAEAAGAAGLADDVATAASARLCAVLDGLAACGLLSDARAAESLLAGPGRRLGSRRLKHALQSKGLAPELVWATLEQSRTTELERARELWRRRFGEPAAQPAERARQARFLAGRGFDADIVRRVVKGLADE
jgi:regulatory protein